MKQPTTMGELRQSLASILAGAMSGDVKESEARIALNAATRITENFQAELRQMKLQSALSMAVTPLGETPINK